MVRNKVIKFLSNSAFILFVIDRIGSVYGNATFL